MALYDGFFDAVIDETTGEYDRAYTSGDFTGYFENLIGSGVCVHNNPNSFKVRLANGKAAVSPGYLFIRGYWLKNDEDYTIDLPGTDNYAIVAHLNLGKRMIELEARSVAQAYPDSLVLAIVSPTSAEDTRYNTDICGVIDTAGDLSAKVEWAVNYIDNEIESKLQAVEQDIAAQEAKLDAKIAEVQAVADSIVPPPIGTIRFSASQDVGEEWLLCNGSFVNESDYPELVAALGKLLPSGDQFQLLSGGEIGPQITNGVVYNGKMWVYSHAARKLYGVDLEGEQSIKEIPVSSSDSGFGQFMAPSTQHPLALSIAPSLSGGTAKLFLAQILAADSYISNSNSSGWKSMMLLYASDFTGSETSLSMQLPFQSVTMSSTWAFQSQTCVPYVVSFLIGGQEWFYCATRGVDGHSELEGVRWKASGEAQNIHGGITSASDEHYNDAQRIAFNPKNQKEAVSVVTYFVSGTGRETKILSTPNEVFNRPGLKGGVSGGAVVANALNVVGSKEVLIQFTMEEILAVSLTDGTSKLVKVTNVAMPDSARLFVDGAAYLWGKNIYMFFVGTGILFSRTLEEGSFGYLDTTSILGTITQFGYLDYSQDENTLYLLGQDTTNAVRLAKLELNTLYDYANDGAWLPMIASDGVPAYIKAVAADTPSGQPVPMSVKIENKDPSHVSVYFNGEEMLTGTFTRNVVENGTFTIGYRNFYGFGYSYGLKINGSIAILASTDTDLKTKTLKVNDYISTGATLTVYQ